MKIKIVFILSIFSLIACKKEKNNDSKVSSTVFKQYAVKKVFPHDTNSFTEGLFLSEGVLFESTGAPENMVNTRSLFGELSLETGKIDVKAELDKSIYFGEGIAKANNKIFQLTYLNKIGFVYDAETYQQLNTFKFENNEGWGLTNIGDSILVMSDGTDVLTFLDVNTQKPTKKIKVTEYGNPVYRLNELEYVNGFIYSNVYTENRILKIDIKTGKVIKSIDLSSLYFDAKNRFVGSMEMNGIAYNSKNGTFYITGKMWPILFEIEIFD
ncbi:glutaminyl-peptide cyclotransferase [Flavobacterium sp. TP390]|uniref:Glutaminyl-peptide cyclotransferase n=1 Tax=Flavobacterium profundi TaxID=1774945 RepID=A0A6I4IU57_9FLAO|nr:glutaminyl-peptide cyclotransferase [Flavobacterium profundi]MVO10396.1 glutaminyl-peptide cyclotransferase [Flavobacterium profundi]